MDRKPRLAFVDHSFHLKTKSVDFMRELMSDGFEVTEFWDDSWQGKPAVSVDEINAGNFDYVLFFQVLPPVKELRKLNAKLIWTPMYDGTPVDHGGFWLQLATLPILIIGFSSTVHSIAERYGISSMYLRYYQDPSQFTQVQDFSSIRVFFWHRTKEITWQNVKQLLSKTTVDEVFLKLNPDPKHEAERPSDEDIKRYNIRIIDGFLEKDEYMGLLGRCNTFIAPRAQEGIGQSFLEAMGMGMVVVGMNRPTMSEYISDGVDGILFSREFTPIDLTRLKELGHASQVRTQRGYTTWERDKHLMIDAAIEHKVTPQTITTVRKIRTLIATGIYYSSGLYKRLFSTT